ncbi:tRNA(Ile)-lysidine synthase [Rubripirellula obstinata]|uniref:tRNA(Ile)-lysidine synthase n=1 Tax=Rubripirellula obstinata TaxID=406547 RepID=A0A5B1CL17_9BACT|nr:tRNA(Ile)-lysidine synthase [Rubripirellula obstinata]
MVVGISGGADSTALLISLARMMADLHQQNRHAGFLIAAHFNHGLRGPESDADQQFSSELAEQWGIQFVSARSTQPCQDEATMSAQRMEFLIDTAKQNGARYIALAHSLDDNVETVLHQLMRGTGPAGLCGIGGTRSVDDDLVLVRPMLRISRDRIRAALQEAGQPWREDSSNASVQYSRNWIRHELIPLIQTRYPAAVPAIDRAIQGQKTWRTTIDAHAENWIQQHQLATSPATFRRDTNTDAAILIAAMQRHWKESGWPRGSMTRDHWQRLAKAFQGKEKTVPRFDLPGGVEVQVLDDQVILRDSTN